MTGKPQFGDSTATRDDNARGSTDKSSFGFADCLDAMKKAENALGSLGSLGQSANKITSSDGQHYAWKVLTVILALCTRMHKWSLPGTITGCWRHLRPLILPLLENFLRRLLHQLIVWCDSSVRWLAVWSRWIIERFALYEPDVFCSVSRANDLNEISEYRGSERFIEKFLLEESRGKEDETLIEADRKTLSAILKIRNLQVASALLIVNTVQDSYRPEVFRRCAVALTIIVKSHRQEIMSSPKPGPAHQNAMPLARVLTQALPILCSDKQACTQEMAESIMRELFGVAQMIATTDKLHAEWTRAATSLGPAQKRSFVNAVKRATGLSIELPEQRLSTPQGNGTLFFLALVAILALWSSHF